MEEEKVEEEKEEEEVEEVVCGNLPTGQLFAICQPHITILHSDRLI